MFVRRYLPEIHEALGRAAIVATQKVSAAKAAHPSLHQFVLQAEQKASPRTFRAKPVHASAIPTALVAAAIVARALSPQKAQAEASSLTQNDLDTIAHVYEIELPQDFDKAREACFSAVFSACQKGDWENAKALSQQETLHRLTNNEGRNLLGAAVANYEYEMVDMFMELGISTLHKDFLGNTPLHIAIKNRSLRLTEKLAKVSDRNARNKKGETPLLLAIKTDKKKILELFFELGVSQASIIRVGRELSPLEYAVYLGKRKSVAFLLTKKQNLFRCPKEGGTFLHWLVYCERFDFLKHLLVEHPDIAKELIQHPDDLGRTPLSLACFLGTLESAKLLGENGADVIAVDQNGWAPIHWAAFGQQNEVMEWLCQKGAKLKTTDGDGKRPLDLIPADSPSRYFLEALITSKKKSKTWLFSSSIVQKKRLSLLPPLSRDFFPRKELSTLEARLKVSGAIALTGLPGMGKTELAKAYAHAHEEDYSIIGWINCETPSTESQSYLKLAQHSSLALYVKNLTNDEAKKAVHRYLENEKLEKPWLLIFDNCNEKPPALLPEKNGHIIYTSTTKFPWQKARIPTYSIDCFAKSEATEYLAKVLELPITEEVEELAENLEGIPLLLSIAATEIVSSPDITVSTYLETIRQKFGDKTVSPLWKEGSQYRKKLVVVLDETLGRLRKEKPLAAEWLEICSFFKSQDIPVEGILAWLEERKPDAKEQEVHEIIQSLDSLSLIQFNPTNKTFSLHRSIHQTIRGSNLAPQRRSDARRLATSILELFFLMNSAKISKRWTVIQRWSDHLAEALLNTLELDPPIKQVKIGLQLGSLLFENGNLQQAETITAHALETAQEAHQNNPHPDTAACLRQMGRVARVRQNIKTAEDYFTLSLSMYETLAEGKPNADVARGKILLAGILNDRGEQQKGIELVDSALTTHRQLHEGAPHSDIVSAMNYKGIALREAGKCDSAIQQHKEALQMAKTLHEDKIHTSIAFSLFCIANALKKKRDYKKALKKFQKSLELSQIIFKEKDHYHTAIIHNFIGDTYVKMGDFKNARKSHEASIEMFRSIYKNQPYSHLANSYHSIGVIAFKKGEFADALKYFTQANEMKMDLYAKAPNKRKAKTLYYLGVTHAALRDREKAIEPLSEAYSMYKELFGEDHPKTQKTKRQLDKLQNPQCVII